MKLGQCVLLVLAQIVTAFMAAKPVIVMAQQFPTPATGIRYIPPLPLGNPVWSPPPEWLVWQAFHDSLEFYEKKSSGSAERLLRTRADLSESAASAFRTAGREYLAQIDKIEDETTQAIKERYWSDGMFSHASSAERSSVTPQNTSRLVAKDGRDLQEALVGDGVVAAVEGRRQNAVREHRRRVETMIGADSLSKIEALLRADVAPRVSIVTRVSPAPLPPGAADRRPSRNLQIPR